MAIKNEMLSRKKELDFERNLMNTPHKKLTFDE